MSKTAPGKTQRRILLAEADVIVRLVLAQHLRECAHIVMEASDAAEAKVILQAGQNCDVLICDPQLPGETNGFAVAQWVRRNRPKTKVVLAATLQAKTLAIVELCGSGPSAAPQDAASLGEKIRVMLAERSRRARRPATTAGARARPRSKRVPN
jgi:CheY-like chemotaxis protein